MRFLITLLLLTGLLVSCAERDSDLTGSGLIEAVDVMFSAEVAGRLEVLYFAEGDGIHKGDTIGLIDTTAISLQLRQAEAAREAARINLEAAGLNMEQANLNLGLAEKEFNRISSLMETGAANQQQFDVAENEYKRAKVTSKQAQAAFNMARAELTGIEAKIAIIEKQFSDCFPVSPTDGTIVDKYIDAGELVTMGKPMAKIARLDTVWVKIYTLRSGREACATLLILQNSSPRNPAPMWSPYRD